MKHALAIATVTALVAGASHATVLRGYTVVTESTPSGAASYRVRAAECPAGTTVLGGGAGTTAGGGARPLLESSAPFVSGGGWIAHAFDVADTGEWSLSVTAICGRIASLERSDASTLLTEAVSIGGFATCLGGKWPMSGGVATGGLLAPKAISRSIPIAGQSWATTIRQFGQDEWSATFTALCIDPDDDLDVFGVSSTTAATTTKAVSVVCPEGRSVLGGGADVDHEFSNGALTSNGPLFDEDEIVGWRAAARASDTVPPNWSLEVLIVCPEPAGASIALLALTALRARRRPPTCPSSKRDTE